MSLNRQTVEGSWSSRWTFVAAATGLAVAIGDFWRLGHEVGEHGGSAFLLIYLAFLLLVATPVMLAETVIGSRGRAAPLASMRHLALESVGSTAWGVFAVLAMVVGVLVLSHLSVIAGWLLAYVPMLITERFTAASLELSAEHFGDLLDSPGRMMQWHSLFLGACLVLASWKMTRLLGQLLRVLMPMLLVMLLVILYSSYVLGDSSAGWGHVFEFRAEEVTWPGVLTALRLAVFTLGVGMASLLVFGAYFPDGRVMGRQVGAVVFLDTMVGLLAALAIYALVLDHHVVPGSGPALLFVTLPFAFGNIIFGDLIGALFFLMLALVALTTAVALLEPAVLTLVERLAWPRALAVLAPGALVWLLGTVSILSLNNWAGLSWRGFNPLQWLDFLGGTLLLPLSALGLVLFVGWCVRRELLRDELYNSSRPVFWLWLGLVRYIAPPAIAVALVAGVYQRLLA